jgi:hypothetical protein
VANGLNAFPISPGDRTEVFMTWAKELYGTIIFFVIVGAVALGVTVGHAIIPLVIPAFANDPRHQLDIQEAKCEMQAASIYKTADRDDVLLPDYVQYCMTATGYDFVGGSNAICAQNYSDALKALQIGQPGDYTMQQDSNCYKKHVQYLFGT